MAVTRDLRYAASIVLTRDRPGGAEVYLVERSPELRFFGGYWAFPGGTLDPGDLAGEEAPDEAAFARCALRELFEETGVLVPELAARMPPDEHEPTRARLLAGGEDATFAALLADTPAALDAVRPVCTLTTPAFARMRYATAFVQIDAPPGPEPRILRGELVRGAWWRPAAAIEAWLAGDLLLAPPVRLMLQMMAEAPDFETFRARARAECDRVEHGGALHEARFSPGILVAPLATPTLPPATTTNCLLVGEQRMLVVDPASYEPHEQARLFAKMEEYLAAGRRFDAVVLTHHHEDHIGAVNAVSRRYDLPVRGHPLTLERIPPGFRRGAPIADGDRIELGRAPDGSPDWHLTALHTPGHDRGHLCFLDSRYAAAIVGDMLSTLSTVIIDPPEGHMRTYLDSLERLLAQPLGMVYPAHGPAHPQGHALIRKLLAHRREREQTLLAALSATPRAPEALLPEVYADAPEAMWPAATRSLLAGLEKLAEDGLAEQRAGGWCRAA